MGGTCEVGAGMPTLTTMQFPAAAASSENAAFGLVTVSGNGRGGSHGRPALDARPAVPYGQARTGGSAGGQASHAYPLGITGHLVPDDGWLLACGAAGWGGFTAVGSGTSSAAAGWV